MVRRYSDDGKSWWNEPPYTEEEELDFYRRIGNGPVTVYRGATMNEKQIQDAVEHLVNRREMLKKDTPEWQAACDAIGKFIDQHPAAGHHAEDYNSNLGRDLWEEQS